MGIGEFVSLKQWEMSKTLIMIIDVTEAREEWFDDPTIQHSKPCSNYQSIVKSRDHGWDNTATFTTSPQFLDEKARKAICYQNSDCSFTFVQLPKDDSVGQLTWSFRG